MSYTQRTLISAKSAYVAVHVMTFTLLNFGLTEANVSELVYFLATPVLRAASATAAATVLPIRSSNAKGIM